MTNDWDKICDPDERVLWQGRPRLRLKWKGSEATGLIFGMLLLAIAFMTMAGYGTSDLPRGVAVILMLTIAGYQIFAPPLKRLWRMRRLYDALTNKRALVWRRTFNGGSETQSHPITNAMQIDLKSSASVSTIHFADTFSRHSFFMQSSPVRTGFEDIEDGQKVYHLMRDIQNGTI